WRRFRASGEASSSATARSSWTFSPARRRAPPNRREPVRRQAPRSADAPPLPDLSADMPGAHLLLQKGRRAKPFAVGLEQNFLNLERQARREGVHELERAHRVTESELAGGVDVLR